MSASYAAAAETQLVSRPAFSIRTKLYTRVAPSKQRSMHVVTITYSNNSAQLEDDWEAYTAAYTAAYNACPRFVLVFDLREMHIPPVPFILKKIALIKSFKWRTTSQVRHACVLVQSEFVASIVTQLLAANRQAAPVTITTDVHALAVCIVQVMYASDGTHAPKLPSLAQTQHTLASAGTDTLQIAIILMSTRFICHFLALLRTRK